MEQLQEFIRNHCKRGDAHVLEGACCRQLSVRAFRQAFKRYIGRHLYEQEIDRMMLQLGFRVLPTTYDQGKLITVRQYRDNESCVYADFTQQPTPRNLGYLDKNRARQKIIPLSNEDFPASGTAARIHEERLL